MEIGSVDRVRAPLEAPAGAPGRV